MKNSIGVRIDFEVPDMPELYPYNVVIGGVTAHSLLANRDGEPGLRTVAMVGMTLMLELMAPRVKKSPRNNALEAISQFGMVAARKAAEWPHADADILREVIDDIDNGLLVIVP